MSRPDPHGSRTREGGLWAPLLALLLGCLLAAPALAQNRSPQREPSRLGGPPPRCPSTAPRPPPPPPPRGRRGRRGDPYRRSLAPALGTLGPARIADAFSRSVAQQL